MLSIVLWDQLSLQLPSIKILDKKNDVILMLEVNEQLTYVKHHKKKLIFLLSAMRHFSQELTNAGYQVIYVKLTDPENTQAFSTEIKRISEKLNIHTITMTTPSEYGIYTIFKKIHPEIQMIEDDRFLCSHAEFKQWAENKKSLRMEFFYREMRKKHHILMQDDLPEGGRWNFDAENRTFPKGQIHIPPTYQIRPDEITKEIITMVEDYFQDHFGDSTPFHYAVTRADALKALHLFIKERLARFGDYQDVMMEAEPWLFHSHISLYLNAGLLLPLECIKLAALSFYEGHAPLNAVEGFIRQILGWREFVRGIYWLKMPHYKNENYLKASRRLPNFYWTGETEMNCVKQCIQDTKQHAYAHHIQRLMVLGNFALLAGINPDEVNEWYLIVYADAHEWVELPNVTGMILFADGGYLASKPYAASGAYIHKMSNYCKNCSFNVKEKNGKSACPFNYLYWNFLQENKAKLKNNHRLKMIYTTLSRMNQDKLREIETDAKLFLDGLDYDYV